MEQAAAVVHSMQTKAIEACDSGALDYTDVSGSFGTYPEDINDAAINPIAENCGPGSAVTFTIDVPSATLSTVCTATLEATGITAFVGC